METVFHLFLSVLFASSTLALALQGFGLPPLSPSAILLLRCCSAISIQWLMHRIAIRKYIKILPLAITILLCVWGFFLLLTSPSWQHATFTGFLADYASPAVCCTLVWILCERFSNR